MRYLKQHPLIAFILIHFIVWSVLPLLRRSLPMDSIEAVVWGQYCTFGTNKHPPLSGWLAYAFYTFGGGAPYALYALSQLCVMVGFIYIFRLATCLLSKEKALFAVMLLEGVIYYGFSAPEFNVNVVSLALWPMCAYYFYKALSTDKLSAWTLLGLAAGANMLNKYVGGFLLLAMGLFMLCRPIPRQKLKKFGPYWSAFVCLLVVAPHIFWLWQHDFFVIDYFLGRSSGKESIIGAWGHIIYPLKFVAAQLLFSLGTLLIYMFAVKNEQREPSKTPAFESEFALWIGALPFVLMFVFSAVTGVRLKSMWGFPVLYMLSILLLMFLPYRQTPTFSRQLKKGVWSVMGLMACIYVGIVTFNKSDKLHMDTKNYGAIIDRLISNKALTPPQYVAGDVWWADNAALFAPSHPKPLIWGDVKKNPWFEPDDPFKKGILLIAGGASEYASLARTVGTSAEPRTFEIEFKNLIGKTKRKTLYCGFYSSENVQ